MAVEFARTQHGMARILYFGKVEPFLCELESDNGQRSSDDEPFDCRLFSRDLIADVEALRAFVDEHLAPKKPSFLSWITGFSWPFKLEYATIVGNDLRHIVFARMHQPQGFERLRAEHVRPYIDSDVALNLLDRSLMGGSKAFALLRMVHCARFWLGSKSSPFFGIGVLAASTIIQWAYADELRSFAEEAQEALAHDIVLRALDKSTINRDLCGDAIDAALGQSAFCGISLAIDKRKNVIRCTYAPAPMWHQIIALPPRADVWQMPNFFPTDIVVPIAKASTRALHKTIAQANFDLYLHHFICRRAHWPRAKAISKLSFVVEDDSVRNIDRWFSTLFHLLNKTIFCDVSMREWYRVHADTRFVDAGVICDIGALDQFRCSSHAELEVRKSIFLERKGLNRLLF